jgi:hypothetical protein
MVLGNIGAVIPFACRAFLNEICRRFMKRLVWLLLAVFGTALVQVPPAALAASAHRSCCCCGGDGSCDMPSCPPAPASSPVRCTLGQPAQVAGVEVSRAVPAPRRAGENFCAALVAPAAVSAAATSPTRVTSAANVPLFTAHCSLLL